MTTALQAFKLPLALISMLLLLAAAPLSAQEEDEVAPDDEELVTLNLIDQNAHLVLDLLEEYTGMDILRKQNLPEISITFTSDDPMTVDQAVFVLEGLLSINGVSITNLSERFRLAVPKNETLPSVPILLEVPPTSLDPSLAVYAYFFKLDYLTTQEAVPLITPLLSTGAPMEFGKNNMILIADSLVNLQRVEQLLQDIDQPPELNTEIIFYQSKHIPASDLQNRLQTIAEGPLSSKLANNTTFNADDRSNQVIVFTHPGNRALIEQLMQNLDVNVAPITRTAFFFLEHADATEVTGLLEEILTAQQSQREEEAPGGRTQRRNEQDTQPTPPATPEAPIAPATPATPAGAAVAPDSAANLQFSSFLTIVADERANAILASGTETDLIYMEELIEKIDIRLPQVRIETVIAEVTLQDDEARGIEAFNISYDPLGDSDLLLSASPTSTSRANPPFDINGTVRPFSLDFALRTARQSNRVEVLSAPVITTSHNEEASIIVAESRPVVTGSTTSIDADLATRSTVQFRDIGIELTVTPRIGTNGNISMEIDQTIENVIGNITIDNNSQPIIGRRQATSVVSVRDGGLIVLGGLQEGGGSKTKGRLAFIGWIPGVGDLLNPRGEERNRRELIIFIRPKILTSDEEMLADAKDNINRMTNRRQIKHYLNQGQFLDQGEYLGLVEESGALDDPEEEEILPAPWEYENIPDVNESDEVIESPSGVIVPGQPGAQGPGQQPPPWRQGTGTSPVRPGTQSIPPSGAAPGPEAFPRARPTTPLQPIEVQPPPAATEEAPPFYEADE